MKIKAKDVLAQTVKVPTEQVQSHPIVEEMPDEELYGDRKNALEYAFVSSGLSYGDRLRVIDDDGNLYDVIYMPNGQIAVQNLLLKMNYGQMQTFNSWEEAEAVIPQGYSIDKAVVASKKVKEMLYRNPYRNK